MTGLCFARVPVDPPPPPLTLRTLAGPVLVLVSGLALGAGPQSQGMAAARDRLVDFLARGDHDLRLLIVCGGIIAGGGGTVSEQLAAADKFLLRLARVVMVHLMPGHGEPTNMSLPQLPFHPQFFPLARAGSGGALRAVSNPYRSRVEGVCVSGHSGQPVQDMLRCSRLSSPLDALSSCLQAMHLAPTAPDTLAAQPSTGRDPFVIEEVPHVLFSAGHAAAAWRWCGTAGADDSEARGTMCICVPAFSSQPAVVLANLGDLQDVRVQAHIVNLNFVPSK